MPHGTSPSFLVANAASVTAIASGYSLKAKGKGAADLILYGDIGESWFGGVSAKQVSDDLKAIGAVDTINVRINSAGGDVFEGLTIYRRLVDHGAKIVTFIDGLAASIASVIAMAGREINISESGMVMIHDAWGIAIGNGDDMRTMAALLDKTTESIRDVYVARTGNKPADVEEWMGQETWFTGQEAVDKKFATSVVENLRIAARFDPAKHRFKRAPAALTDKPNVAALKQRLALMKSKMDRRRAA